MGCLFRFFARAAAFRISLAAALSLVVFSFPVSAAGARIEGRVLDAKTRKPLPLANIYIPSTDRVTVTDSKGCFALDGLGAGKITLTFSYIGYQEKTITVHLEENKKAVVSIDLAPTLLYIKEITVTATRTEKDPLLTPNTTYSLTQEDLYHKRIVCAVPDALKEIPGVMVQKTARGQGSPFMRGFTGFRNLFLIDGVRLNNSTFRDGPNQYWNTVDHFSIGRLEVVKGPGSVLYGSDAIGGTVNAISASPDGTGGNVVEHGKAYYRYAGAENCSQGRTEIGGGYASRFSYTLGASYKDFGDLQGGERIGVQPKTGYDEWSGDLKLEYLINPDSKITGLHQTVEQNDIWRTHATIYGKSWEGTSIGNEKEQVYDQRRHLTYIQYQGNEPFSFVDQLKINLSYQVNNEERSRVRNNDKSEIQGFDVKTMGAWFQADKQTSLGKWTYGAEFYRDEVGSFQRNYKADGSLDKVEIQGPVADDATYDLTGVYCQNDIQTLRSVDLILGARYSYFKADAAKVRNPLDGSVMSISDHWDSFVGSLRALFHAGKANNHIFFGGVSQGFRAPNLSDLTRFDTARSNEIETASPNLAPEKFITYETGFKTRQDRLVAQVSYFYTSIEDMIIRVPTGAMIDNRYEVTKMNSGYGYVHGAEISLILTILDQLRLSGSLSRLEGKIEGFPASSLQRAREPISRLMPATGQLSIRWESNRRGYWLEGCLSAADTQDKLSASDKLDTQRIPPGGTPGYAVFDLRGGWKIGTHVEISTAIENIADEDYRIHGSGLNEPGRNLVIGVSCGF